jgi:acetoin utilization deacetylase AcuC-like enzyme
VAVLDDGFDRKVGIIDLDAHWANGTVDILAAMPDVAARVEHFNFGGDVRDRTPQGIRAWMQELPWIVDGIASRCGLVIFQAGADPHVSDPLGGFMTSAEMRERDRIVFRTCARRRVPIAWNLAGGYQEPFHRVLALHDATMEECVAAFAGQPG